MFVYLRAFDAIEKNIYTNYKKFNPKEGIEFVKQNMDKYIYEYVKSDQPIKLHFHINLKKDCIYNEDRFVIYLNKLIEELKKVSHIDTDFGLDSIKISQQILMPCNKHLIFDRLITTSINNYLFVYYMNRSIDKESEFFCDPESYRCANKNELETIQISLPVGIKDMLKNDAIFEGITIEDSLISLYNPSKCLKLVFKDHMQNKYLIKLYIERNHLRKQYAQARDEIKELSKNYDLALRKINTYYIFNSELISKLEFNRKLYQEIDDLKEKNKELEALWDTI